MNDEKLSRLIELRNRAIATRASIIDTVQREKRSDLTAEETKKFRAAVDLIKDFDQQIADTQDDIERSGRLNPTAVAVANAIARGGGDSQSAWAARAADALRRMAGEQRAISSGSIEVPSIILPSITPKTRPERLIDLLVNRVALQSNSHTYWRQTVRTNAAAPVADLAVKPTSTFTIAEVEDRARVIAHLSEEIPVRLWQDAADVVRWLEAEMVAGVLDAVESQIINGSGSGENMTGLLNVTGTTAVAYSTDVPTTLRKALTSLENIGVKPTAWVLNPADAEAIDLLRFSATGTGETAEPQAWATDGYVNRVAGSGNIFGDGSIARVTSPSIPAGTAILGEWSQLRLAVREQVRLDVDAGGELFTRNAARLRAETRVGVQHLRPASFAKIDLTP